MGKVGPRSVTTGRLKARTDVGRPAVGRNQQPALREARLGQREAGALIRLVRKRGETMRISTTSRAKSRSWGPHRDENVAVQVANDLSSKCPAMFDRPDLGGAKGSAGIDGDHPSVGSQAQSLPHPGSLLSITLGHGQFQLTRLRRAADRLGKSQIAIDHRHRPHPMTFEHRIDFVGQQRATSIANVADSPFCTAKPCHQARIERVGQQDGRVEPLAAHPRNEGHPTVLELFAVRVEVPLLIKPMGAV